MAPKVPLGISEFRQIREGGLRFVDKSELIRDCLDDTAKVLLLPRPRRFGKTTALSMLRCYLERSAAPAWPLFEGLAIAGAGPAYRAHLQRYPTIALTFKDVKARTWDRCRAAMAAVVAEAFREHLDASADLHPAEAAMFQDIAHHRADDVTLWNALRFLCRVLASHHGERVLVLVDEYDTPLHEAYVHGYYDDAVEFFRNFLSGGLKDNPHLFKGVLTGVLRMARDSLFTGLNNLEVYSILRPEYATHFGFTEPEVRELLAEAGATDRLPEVQRWYNGYVIGGHTIYNPWSVLSFIKSQDREVRPYWVSTGSDQLIRDLLAAHGPSVSADMERLMRGEIVERPIAEQVALRDVRGRGDLLFSFLLFTGYLKVVGLRREEGVLHGALAVPNLEVMGTYQSIFRECMDEGLGGARGREALVAALLAGDAERCALLISDWLLRLASYHDTAAWREPERFYHGFVLGLLADQGGRYQVLSNREWGLGRCDVTLTPRQPGQPGVALELKAVDPERGETKEEALDEALRQLAERDYGAGLRAAGAAPVHELALVFQGKRAWGRRRSVLSGGSPSAL